MSDLSANAPAMYSFNLCSKRTNKAFTCVRMREKEREEGEGESIIDVSRVSLRIPRQE